LITEDRILPGSLTAVHIPSLIEKKRDGHELSRDEIAWLISEFAADRLPDYQMSALAMAVFFRDMTTAETLALTQAMLQSGETFSWPDGHPPIVDKHSTGGIGDKTSLVLAPLLACDGLWVPMISGRGLGITGGTLDKLESIPGFRVGLGREQAIAQVEALGVAMIGQTPQLCPADKKLYALRDVTGTVPSQPLIVASIMSKKLAEGLDRLSLDVKFGTGTFMQTRASADELARAMIQVGTQRGVATHARLTPMAEPLGRTVGNALEVQECLDTLRGHGPRDLVELTLDLCEPIAHSPRAALERRLTDGSAWRKFQQLVDAQGGDLEAFARRPPAPVIRELKADRSGFLSTLDAGAVGRAAVALGAGRSRTDAIIDPRVGFDEIAKRGAPVRAGDLLVRAHGTTEESVDAALATVRKGILITGS
jgi:pyrimidine-nucleoside phosphorylase